MTPIDATESGRAPQRRPLLWLIRAGSFAAAGALIALLAYGLSTGAPDQGIDEALASGEPAAAPGFELAVLAGGRPPRGLAKTIERAGANGRIALGELRGHAVVLNMWASWCVPCRVEAPALERAWRRHGRNGVIVLGLNQEDVTSDARAFIDEFKLTYPNVREGNDATSRAYGAVALPETYFISARGQVVGHVIGRADERALERGIAAARSGRPIAAR